MSQIERKISKKYIILILCIVLLIILNLILVAKNFMDDKNKKQSEGTITHSVNKKEDNSDIKLQRSKDDIVEYLSGLDERSRMEYYCGEYLKHLKYKEYEEAYKLLYSEFKDKYFPTLEEYKEYVESFYPSFFAVQYDDIDRQGDIYVVRLKIIDATNSKSNNSNNESNEENDDIPIQRFVIKENDFNDFVMSFQI